MPLSLFLSIALPQPFTDTADVPPMVVASAAATDARLRFRPIEVCGRVSDRIGPEGESILDANRRGLMVEARPERLPAGLVTCVLGVVLRRDGLTDREAAAQGRFSALSHGVHPHYILYRCSDMAECRALSRSRRHEPVRDNEARCER